MAKITIPKSLLDKLRGLEKPITRETAQIIGEEVVAEMSLMIAKGISPVAGQGRFPGYKHQGVPGKYPASAKTNYPAKRDRPVNLNLSGAFDAARSYKLVSAPSGWAVVVGYFDKKSQDKEEGHAVGVNGQPRRPTIPTGKQEFAASIQNIIRKRFREAISKIVKS